MDSNSLYNIKNDTKCVFLNDKIIQTIMDSFSKSNIKVIKYVKKQVNVMKTNKIQAKKDLNENKIIMIMNKISDNNINELIGDYLNNILMDTEEKYNTIILEIFNKMIKDIKFIDNYIKFAIKIFIIEKKRLNLIPETFIEILINTLININSTENDRAGCYEIIKHLVKYNFFNDSIINFISNYVLNTTDTNHYIDVYNWFNGLNIINNYNISSISKKCEEYSMNREKILIDSLIDSKKIININTVEVIENNNDVFKTSINNILDEYEFLKSIDEVIEFINTDCININEKNTFCKEFIIFYNDKNISEGLNLIDLLIKKKVLFKSNISKGLILYLQEINNDTTKNSYIIEILKYLKNNNITKNIEHIFKKYKVKLFYEN
jgi:hypothetical protein